MTGNEFLEQLASRADFLSPEDLEKVTGYYENKILKAKSADEEEKIVAGFGSIDLIIRKLKMEFLKPSADSAVTTAPQTKAPAEPPENTAPRDDDGDVKVFVKEKSKTPPVRKRPMPQAAKKPAKPQRQFKRKFYGLANTLLDKINAPKEKRQTYGKVLKVVFSPVFILLTLALLFVYVGALSLIIAAAAVLGVLELVLILLSVAELVYGIIMFFTSVPVALIEIGLGTMLIGVVTAITALVYQLLTGVIPVAMKKITSYYKLCFAYTKEFIFGTPEGGDEQ